ncbi:response regulator [Flavobacteriaceae bacterium LMO-SS05]
MFSKVLISEDMDDINKGVYNVLIELGVEQADYVQYCDDAYIKFKKALLDHEPYDLLITDLSFKSDHRKQQLSNGVDLIKKLKEECPNIKVMVYTIEDRIHRVRRLIEDYHINAYVCKGRKGLVELSKAIHVIQNGALYLSPEVRHALSPRNELEIDDFDIYLLKQLSLGLSQEDISTLFSQEQISPSSLSSIEKRLNRLRIQFKAKNATHLVAIIKDLGII